MRVAVVHDWLLVRAGAENVLEAILELFPAADLFTLVDFLPSDQRSFLGPGRQIRTSFIQSLPGAARHHRLYLPLMPLAVEQFDLRGYDLVISSSYAVAKGVITGPNQLHIAYVHSPMRYIWDLQFQYLARAGLDRGPLSLPLRWLLHRLRLWDSASAVRVDHYLANSAFVARRIRKFYRREATVIHPPVDTAYFTPANGPLRREPAAEIFYLTVSRLVPYKRIDLLIDAFVRVPGRRLVIVGDGPERERLQRQARPAGARITLLGARPRSEVRDLMRRAAAFLFAAEEDFGIVPLEAQACGCPVIAYGRGGVCETIVTEGNAVAPATGIFFLRPDAEALNAALERFEADPCRFSSAACRANAERFCRDIFLKHFREFINHCLERGGWGQIRAEKQRQG